MRLTIIGSGDAFGSGGRFNTCFFLETAKGKLLVDCGASSLVALKAQGLDPNEVDGIVLSHLHGDHFGALPFLLMDAQFLMRRERPLLIAISPILKADTVRLHVSREEDGKLRLGPGWDDTTVVQPDGCGQARRGVEWRNLPATGGSDDPPFKN
jgi:ribonuclease BN (tRNA processing enzyme)